MTGQATLGEPEFDLFHEYWEALRSEQVVPARADFDPLTLPALLPNMSILGWEPPDMLRWRLMGTRIVDQTNLERTGTNLLDVMYPPQREMVKELSAPVFERPAIALSTSYRCFASRKSVEVKFAFFPFRSESGDVDVCIGVHKPNEEQARRVMPDDPLSYSQLTAYRYVDIGNGVPDRSFEGPLPPPPY